MNGVDSAGCKGGLVAVIAGAFTLNLDILFSLSFLLIDGAVHQCFFQSPQSHFCQRESFSILAFFWKLHHDARQY